MDLNGGNVWVYTRMSTRKQDASPAQQLATCQDYIRRKLTNYGTVSDITDAAVSGKTPFGDRAGGKKLLSFVRPGDHVVIAKLDRAFRNLRDGCEVMERFKRLKVTLHVCDFQGGEIDLNSPMGMFMFQVMVAFAELERAFISERTRIGLAHRLREGRKKDGRTATNYPGLGFKWEQTQVIVTEDGVQTTKTKKVRVRDEYERGIMREIARWRLQEDPLSWQQIFHKINHEKKWLTRDGKLWSINRIRRAARAEFKLQQEEQYKEKH